MSNPDTSRQPTPTTRQPEPGTAIPQKPDADEPVVPDTHRTDR
jgi:hypothetical protein